MPTNLRSHITGTQFYRFHENARSCTPTVKLCLTTSKSVFILVHVFFCFLLENRDDGEMTCEMRSEGRADFPFLRYLRTQRKTSVKRDAEFYAADLLYVSVLAFIGSFVQDDSLMDCVTTEP